LVHPTNNVYLQLSLLVGPLQESAEARRLRQQKTMRTRRDGETGCPIKWVLNNDFNKNTFFFVVMMMMMMMMMMMLFWMTSSGIRSSYHYPGMMIAPLLCRKGREIYTPLKFNE